MLSNNIKFLREQQGLTQAQLADIAGVTDKAVSTWENGTYQPRMGAIERICGHFNVTKSALLDTDMASEFAQKEKPLTNKGEGLSDKEQIMQSLFQKLNSENREILIGIAGQLKDRQEK